MSEALVRSLLYDFTREGFHLRLYTVLNLLGGKAFLDYEMYGQGRLICTERLPVLNQVDPGSAWVVWATLEVLATHAEARALGTTAGQREYLRQQAPVLREWAVRFEPARRAVGLDQPDCRGCGCPGEGPICKDCQEWIADEG